MGDILYSPVVPKQIYLIQYDHLNDFLTNAVESKKYPNVTTLSLEGLQEKFKKNPINPNELLVNYLLPPRKEFFWLSPGDKAENKMEELLSDINEEEFQGS